MKFKPATRKTSTDFQPDDHLIVERVQNGDRDAFDELIKRYYGAIHNLVAHSITNLEEREDLLQDIFLKAYRNIRTFRFESSFSTWLYAIARNMLIDRTRKRELSMVSLEKEEGGIRIEDRIKDKSSDPEKIQVERDADELLREILMSLDEDHKQILILREMEGLSYKELSKILKINIGTVKSRLARAREELRIKLIEKNSGLT